MFTIWSLSCFLLGVFSGVVGFRMYQSRLIRFLPDQASLKLRLFLGGNLPAYDPSREHDFPENEDLRIIVTIENEGDEEVHFESWAVRSLNAQGYLRQLFSFPQNFVQTLRPKEKMNFEIRDLAFLSKGQLYTIVLRDIYGREWTIDQEEMQKIRKDLYWQVL